MVGVFCQQYCSHSSANVKSVIQRLEEEIRDLESNITDSNSTDRDRLQHKEQELCNFLNERAKGALLRSRFTTIRDMDAPTSFFFGLEKSESGSKQMACLQLPGGRITTNPMKRHAVDYYSKLFQSETCCRDSVDELLQGLPQLTTEDREVLLHSITTFDDKTFDI
ncbi:hypothetical protein JOB18_001728 [Solea senegalensis]|uniref:Uncharacterized protein n=1 Tax=Solea senegalensis TaxID=28829 RepID=A0AAV6PQ14_SOLSE|nr:hypothetical protein JOB18_001728 [Solea senegalensis]